MLDFQQKRQIKKVIYSRVTIFILFVVVIFLARSTYSIYKKEQLSSANYNETKKEYDSLKERQTMLSSEISSLKTDTGIEEEIRSKFNVAKPGETVVVVVDNTASSTTNSNGQNLSLWQRLLNLFK